MSIQLHSNYYTMNCNGSTITDDYSIHPFHFEIILTREIDIIFDLCIERIDKYFSHKKVIKFSELNTFLLLEKNIFDRIVECTNFVLEYKKIFIESNLKNNDEKWSIDTKYKSNIFKKFFEIMKNLNTNLTAVLSRHNKIPKIISDFSCVVDSNENEIYLTI